MVPLPPLRAAKLFRVAKRGGCGHGGCQFQLLSTSTKESKTKKEKKSALLCCCGAPFVIWLLVFTVKTLFVFKKKRRRNLGVVKLEVSIPAGNCVFWERLLPVLLPSIAIPPPFRYQMTQRGEMLNHGNSERQATRSDLPLCYTLRFSLISADASSWWDQTGSVETGKTWCSSRFCIRVISSVNQS